MKDKLGIEPNCFQLESDYVREEYSNKNNYSYSKKLSLEIKADLPVLSKLTSLLAELSDVEYDVDFELSDEIEKEKQVIDAAIKNSRDKAEMIASSLGKKIQGVDEINYEQPSEAKYGHIAKSLTIDDSPV